MQRKTYVLYNIIYTVHWTVYSVHSIPYTVQCVCIKSVYTCLYYNCFNININSNVTISHSCMSSGLRKQFYEWMNFVCIIIYWKWEISDVYTSVRRTLYTTYTVRRTLYVEYCTSYSVHVYWKRNRGKMNMVFLMHCGIFNIYIVSDK